MPWKPKPVRDLSGQSFGRLTVLRLAEHQPHNATMSKWCSCGNVKDVQSSSLVGGNTRSCGRLRRDAALAREMTKRES